MEDNEELSLRDIYKMKEEGAMLADLEGEHHYVLVLHELYVNGTTSPGLIEEPAVGQFVGQLTGLGPVTDSSGFAVWEVDEVVRRRLHQPPQEEV